MSEEEKIKQAIRCLNNCANNNIPLPEEALSWVKITLEYIDKLEQKIEKLTKEYKARIADNLELEEIYNNTDTLEIDKRLMINAEIIVLNELLGE